MILFSLLIEKLNSWRSWHLGGSLFISILCNAKIKAIIILAKIVFLYN
jgi:hypothetical protein